MTDDEMHKLFREGSLRNLSVEHRHVLSWDKGDVFFVGRLLRTPRGSTIERPHIERGVEHSLESSRKTPEKLKVEFETLQQRIKLETIEKEEEENVRWDIWGELQREFYRSLTVSVPEKKWLAGEQASRAVPAMPLAVGFDQRTPNGIGRDVGPSTSAEQEAA